MATVIECRYDAGAVRAMAFGLPLSKHFLIRFNYWADGELLSSEFQADTVIPQGALFPVRYNPIDPAEVRRILS